MLRRLARGELGSLRVLFGIAVIWTIFQIANDRFLSAVNLSNLTLQIAAVATISIGVVLVLLLGEIDLSVGAVSGLAAAVMAVLAVKEAWTRRSRSSPGSWSGPRSASSTASWSRRSGSRRSSSRSPGLLGWQGAQLLVLGDTGSVQPAPSSSSPTSPAPSSTRRSAGSSAIVAIAAYAASLLIAPSRGGCGAGLEAPPLGGHARRVIVLVAAAIIAAVAILNADRGVPLAALIVVVLMVFFTFLTERTRYGPPHLRRRRQRGGGAARRHPRQPDQDHRLRARVDARGCAAASSPPRACSPSTSSPGSGDVLLLAIAGPVIAGTSLFGGRGFVWSALLGAIVIGSISNGMDLLALDSDIKFMITGAVLLAAVTIDAIARRSREPG